MYFSAAPNCEYGDLTPRCLNVRQRSHLCYLPENQRLCCATCPSLANHEEPGEPQRPRLHSRKSGTRNVYCFLGLSHIRVSTHVSTAYRDTKGTSHVRRRYVGIRSSYSSISSSYSSYAEVLRFFMCALKNS